MLENPVFRKILLAVSILHGIFFVSFSLNQSKKAQKIAVNRIYLKQPQLVVAKEKVSQRSVKKSFQKSNKPKKRSIKKKPIRKIASKKPATKKKIAKKESSKKDLSFLQDIQESLSKVEKVEMQKGSQKISQKIKALEELDTSYLVEKMAFDYSDRLASFLRDKIQLAEKKSVEISLTLDKNGRVISFDIVHSQSLRNKKLIEDSLHSLIFPSFSQIWKEDKKTFQLVLTPI